MEKAFCKVKGHCYCAGKCKSAANFICNLKCLNTLKKFLWFLNMNSTMNYHELSFSHKRDRKREKILNLFTSNNERS